MRENTLVSFANQRVVAVPFLIGATKDEATCKLSLQLVGPLQGLTDR